MSSDDITIEILSTPNPDALMFRLDEVLVPQGSFEFSSLDDAGGAPLAQALFAVPGTAGVLIARNFVTITRAEGTPWQDLSAGVQAALRAFVDGGGVAVEDVGEATTGGTDVEQRIARLIAESIQPALEADGGAIDFVGFEDGVVKARLRGACGTCPHATATLAFGVKRFLMQHVPEVTDVVRVD
jgi:NFU1 iron-sulfur cluster scaffold homolog, mitochondrial